MSSRVPEPCDVPRGDHEGPVRFYAAGWRCAAHRPAVRPRDQTDGLPQPPHYSPAKLTPAQRDEIRRRAGEGETALALAAEFGVSVRTIRQNS